MLYTAMYANLGLVLAATNKKRRAINVLKTSKADIPETPLHDACESGHTDAVRKLLRRGALVDAKDKAGRTPLHIACANGHTDAILLLLDRGALIDAKAKKFGVTPLHIACKSGHPDAVRLLLDRGALIEAKDNAGRSALDLAGTNDEIRVVLLSYQVQVLEIKTESLLCCVCLSEPRSVVLLPCKHMCACAPCSSDPRFTAYCPICRVRVKKTMAVYI